MTYRFLYIDDNPTNDSQSLIEVINSYKLISVFHEKPGAWSVTNELVDKYINEIDGLIIDWKLNEFIDSVDFNTEAFVQELRLRISDQEKSISSIPIVLCSANPDFAVKYLQDRSKHNLFDLVLDKQKLTEQFVSVQLAALAEGYKIINRQSDILKMLAIEDSTVLDTRFFDILGEKLKIGPISETVQFLMKDFIGCPGILIDESLLAVRLGIDKDSSEGWNDVKRYFVEQQTSYEGIFSSGWRRFWMPLLNSKWKELTGRPFRAMAADEKVEFLLFRGFKNIKPIKLQEMCISNKFWTICVNSNVAIDTVDGLLASCAESTFPWQDLQYISPLSAVKETGVRVAKSELHRLDNYKSLYEQTHVRNRK